jgi:hypothetical protein
MCFDRTGHARQQADIALANARTPAEHAAAQQLLATMLRPLSAPAGSDKR